MSDLHLRRGRLFDPASGLDREGDVILREGRIAALGKGLATPAGAVVVDARDLLLVPGLVDLHVHLREPGEEYKEDIRSGTAAAAAGGFAAVCSMPNTKPPNDCRSVTELILARAREAGLARVYPVGAISKGLEGKTLADIGDLAEAGCVAITDDGRPVMSALVMRRAMEYARSFGLTVTQHAEDLDLSGKGSMNEGAASTRAGLRGQPAQAEEVIVARDIALAELTGARYHVAHLSTAAALARVREAKSRGLPVTCEVTPHHLTLTDEACTGYDTSTKVNPPLRTPADIEALIEALAEGTIDAIATDHAPHSSVEKELEFDEAAFGMIGLETALPLVLSLVVSGKLSLGRAIECLTSRAARVYGLSGGTLAEGAPGDVTAIDLARRWTYDPSRGKSKSANSPFAGRELVGMAVLTVVAGRVVHDTLSAVGR
ncbi:MAG: dihydroorotase [Planctomycetes bacterium]|nr:dihydroorotase [Planctomycetota bacterium]